MSGLLQSVRNKSGAAVLAACVVLLCFLCDSAPALNFRRSAHAEPCRIGDSVFYETDGLAYEVIGQYGDNLLLRRGDDMAYAVQSEVRKLG